MALHKFFNSTSAHIGAAILLATSLAACQPAGESDSGPAKKTTEDSSADADKMFFTMEDGKLKRPEGFREWVYVGTPLTPNDMNNGAASFPEFHNVYIDPVSWDIYKKTGKFRDGTIIVKELTTVGSKKAVSGNGYFMGEFAGLEATIKSSKYFPDEPGNWAYFSFGHEYPLANNAEAFPSEACNACHLAAAADDFVFTQYYPVLRARSASPAEQGAEMMDKGAKDALAGAMGASTAAMGQGTPSAGHPKASAPTDPDKLFAFLTSGEYKKFPVSDKGTHESVGPHGDVRVFFDEAVAKSLKAGNKSHPAGSTIVKEQYDKGGKTLTGWSVAIKTQDNSDNGKGWFWYEVLSTTDGSKLPITPGNGVPMCSGCHTIGKDYVISGLPK